MGSVLDNTKCPHCNYEYAMSDYYYKSGEQYVSCSRCGSYYAYEIVNRPEKEYPSDWKPIYKETTNTACHGFCIGGEGSGVRSCGGLKKKELKEFLEGVKENPKITFATYTYKYGGEWFEKDVITGDKRPFVGMYEEQYTGEENE